MEIKITLDNDGRRLDRFLRVTFPSVPLGQIMKSIRTGFVRLDGKRAKQDTRLAEGQILSVPWGEAEQRANQLTPNTSPNNKTDKKNSSQDDFDLNVLYQDEHVLVVEKPSGLLTQPSAKGEDSLITRVLRFLDWQRHDFVPATVQRLDRNTSGAVIVPLNGKSLRVFAELIREEKITKIYRALVSGEVPDEGKIDAPLQKDPATNTVKVAENGKGQRAVTLFKKIKDGKRPGEYLVEANLVTGRPHQARVHLSHIGCPIVGDAKYGSVRGPRLMLHAYRLIFPDDERLRELSPKLCGLEVTCHHKLFE